MSRLKTFYTIKTYYATIVYACLQFFLTTLLKEKKQRYI